VQSPFFENTGKEKFEAFEMTPRFFDRPAPGVRPVPCKQVARDGRMGTDPRFYTLGQRYGILVVGENWNVERALVRGNPMKGLLELETFDAERTPFQVRT
jgi:hypothetical protein